MKNAEVFEMQKLLLLEADASLIDGLAYSLKKNGFDIEMKWIYIVRKVTGIREPGSHHFPYGV